MTKPGCTAYTANNVTDMHSTLVGKIKRKGNRATSTYMGTNRKCESFKSKSFTPGPGAYALNSAFGHYISKFAEDQGSAVYSCAKLDAESRATTVKNSRMVGTPTHASFIQQKQRP